MSRQQPYVPKQRVRCRYENDNGDVVTRVGVVKRILRLGSSVADRRWSVEVDELPGRAGLVAYLIPGEDSARIKAEGFPPLTRRVKRDLVKASRKFGHTFQSDENFSLYCARCHKLIHGVYCHGNGRLGKQLSQTVRDHLIDPEACRPD